MSTALAIGTSAPTAGTRWLGALGITVTTIGFVAAAGPLGLLAGLVLGGVWYRQAPVYGFAIGHVLLLLVPGPALWALVAVELGLLAVLAAPLLSSPRPRLAIAAFAATVLGALVFLWLVRTNTDQHWLVVLVLLGTLATVSYGLHRYERLRLALLEAPS